MGFLGTILGPAMNICYKLVKNYGLAIILFTLFSKLILLPVAVWVQKNSIKMVKMEPDINRIKIKYFGDKDTIADKQSELYKKEKYNPLASLVPLTIQIVLLMGVVEVIYHPLNHVLGIESTTIDKIVDVALENAEGLDQESSSLQLAVIEDIQSGEHDSCYLALEDDNVTQAVATIKDFNMEFLGFDLSWTASVKGGIAYLAPLIAGISAWLLCLAQNAINVLQTEQSAVNKYGMMIFSVALSLYLGTFVPAGVALYWVASNLFAILQQFLMNKAINPAKYVDYEALEETKKELASLKGGEKKRKFNDPLTKREKADYKRFFSVQNKHLVFYSESNGFYKYYKGMIEFILENTNIPIHYITSDPDDQIFEMEKREPNIHAYFIGSTQLITLMMKMDADVVVMTMPDLETYQIKRSYVRKDIEYINVSHGMGSLNLTFRKGALDHFDTVFAVGTYQKEEIEKQEEFYHLPKKYILKGGYPLLDDMRAAYVPREKKPGERKKIMIAPSWQKDNIVDSCLDELLENLDGYGYEITVRPHPQHVRHMPERMEQLKKRFENSADITVQTDFSSTNTVFESDLVITDWSDIAYEFAYTTTKPVLFIDTPMKIMNPEYKNIDTVPVNIWMRNVIGKSMKPEDMDHAAEMVQYLLEHEAEYRDTIDRVLHENIYNLGVSAEVGARYIIRAVFSKTKLRLNQEK